MKFIDNIFFIIGGIFGIGCVLVEVFYKLGNQVIIGGCCKVLFDEVIVVNFGMQVIEFDVFSLVSIEFVVVMFKVCFFMLNVFINNVGIMFFDDVGGIIDDQVSCSIFDINLFGLICLMLVLIDLFKVQLCVIIIYNILVLVYVLLVVIVVYLVSKVVLYLYVMLQCFMLCDILVWVQEIVLFWVDIDLVKKSGDLCVMLLEVFIVEIMVKLVGDEEEIIVEFVKLLCDNLGVNEYVLVNGFNVVLIVNLILV